MSFSTPGADQRAAEGDARLPYMPGLDGLRALAVAAVLLFHAGLERWAGGFLGVEAFFALSGYLITSLLLAEWARRGRISLRRFWGRRARRLLPALFLMLLVVVPLGAVLLPYEPGGLFGNPLPPLGYVRIGRLVLGEQPYFDPFVRPPLLQHLWSLAIEEQFYLVWPLLIGFALPRMRRGALLAALVVAALASAALMAVLFQPDADPGRVYYGTDTRAAGLLLGAALAVALPPGHAAGGPAAGRLLDGLGALALAALVGAFALLHQDHPLLYRGGFAAVSALTVAVIAAVAHPGARLVPGLLGLAPLRWIGRRSYGIYLWHWPIFMVTRPYMDVELDGPPLLALRFGATLVVAALSFHFLERPVQRGALGRTWRRLRPSPSAPPQ